MSEKYISNILIKELLAESTVIEKKDLSRLLSDKDGIDTLSNKNLEYEICGNRGYLHNLHDVATKLEIKPLKSYYNEVVYFEEIEKLKFSFSKAKKLSLQYTLELENKIILHIMEKSYKTMSEEDRQKFDKGLQKVIGEQGSSSNSTLVGTAGLLVLGNMGGFATYTFLTTTMSALSFGTLGFGAYTMATSLLSVALGPVGWTALGIWAIFKLGQPNYKKLIPLVLTTALIRQRIIHENKDAFRNEPNNEAVILGVIVVIILFFLLVLIS